MDCILHSVILYWFSCINGWWCKRNASVSHAWIHSTKRKQVPTILVGKYLWLKSDYSNHWTLWHFQFSNSTNNLIISIECKHFTRVDSTKRYQIPTILVGKYLYWSQHHSNHWTLWHFWNFCNLLTSTSSYPCPFAESEPHSIPS